MPARVYEFDDDVKREAFKRQKGMCAHCGILLYAKNKDDWMVWRSSPDVERGYAHHVVPNQCGGAFDPNRSWLRSAENCVYLCHECHWLEAHSGDFRMGTVLNPEWYIHSHGLDQEHHRKWSSDVTRLSVLVWADRQARAKSGQTSE